MYSNGNGKSSSTLEREAEQSRAQLSATLDELRHSMSPGQILDQAVDYAKETGGADFLRNLGQQVKANPLPVTLIGAGIAWLMMANGRRPRSPGYSRQAHPSGEAVHGSRGAMSGMTETLKGAGSSISSAARAAGSTVSDVAASVSGAARSAASGVSGAAASVSGAASDAMSGMRRTAGSAGDSMSSMGSQISDGLSSASDSAWNSGRRIADSGMSTAPSMFNTLKDQPLLFGALGVAVGAAIGAALPATRTENEYLGAASDSLKEQAREVAAEQYSHVKEAAENTVEAVKSEADKQGLTGDGAQGLSGMVAKAGTVADKAMKTAEKEATKVGEGVSSAADEKLPSGSGSASSSGSREGAGSVHASAKSDTGWAKSS